PPRKLVPEVSERLDWAIRRAMSADPEMRPATCREFVEDLTGRSTRRGPTPHADPAAPAGWYLGYVGGGGGEATGKGRQMGIRRSLREGRVGDAADVRASRDKKGPWEPLRTFPEFRDLVIEPAALPLAGRTPAPQPAAGRPPLKDRSLPPTNLPPSQNAT